MTEAAGSNLLISVIIPTCNRNDQLSVCLDRLREQTFDASRFEVIVTDDSQVQSARELVTRKYPWVRWTQGPRRGPAANRNHGASLAKGEFLAFTDDDCIPSLQWLTGFVNTIADGTDVYEGCTTCDAGIRSPRMHAPINLHGGALWSCNMMVRRSVFAVHHFDESFPFPNKEDDCLREEFRAAEIDIRWVPQAIVDHPPRRVPSVRRLATMHECDVILYGKLHRKIPSLPLHLYRVARFRWRNILDKPLSFDSILATFETGLELAIVATKYGGWRRRYARAGEGK